MNRSNVLKTRFKATTTLISLISIVVLATAGLFVFSPPSPAKSSSTTLTLNPAADAYVNQSQVSKNFGADKSLRVDGSPLVRAYLRFNVSGITTGTVVNKITLRIYANSHSNGGFSVRKVADNNWQENQIDYNNAPATGDEVGTSKSFNANGWANVDVTPLLKADGTFSIALVGIDHTAINLASRESGSHAPQLVIETTTVSTPVPTTAPSKTAAPSATATLLPPATVTPLASATATLLPSATKTVGPTATAGADYQPAFPIRAAFYYPWFPEAWNQQGFNPFTNYTPSLGFYDSGSVSVIQNHIRAMTYGNIKAAILSWWGQGSKTDQRVATILSATPGSSNPNFRWSIYYENESMGDPAVSQLQSDIAYIGDHYGKDASFLRINGKFVIFVYSDGNDACGMADRWAQANNALGNPAYVVLKVFAGYRTCASQPNSWHQYSPAVPTDDQKGYSYAISPGFWKKGDAVRLARNLSTWVADVKAMVTANEPWQLVTTFSEWGEGTSVESAQEWASASGYGQYLDALHDNGNSAPPQPSPTSQPTNPPAPTVTPTAVATLLPTLTQTPTKPPAPTPTPTVQPTQPSSGNDPIIFFTGDLVSGSSVSRAQSVVNLIKNLMAQHPGTQFLVASTGDNEQENNPTIANYQAYFGTTFGTFVTQGIFQQVRGNHDIQSAGAYTDYNGTVHSTGAAYWDYFGTKAHAANINGQKLTNYSYNLGNWHIVALDQLNGSVNSATLGFLKADLAANTSKQCQIVYWHVPTYSSGSAHGDSTGLVALNQAEYDAGVDIQLNGHDHDYQRFYPINPSGVRDDAKGITTFIDGIGGQDGRSGSKTSIAQAASALYLDAFPGGSAIGVIQFTLHANSADYALYNANDGSMLDNGTVTCR